MAEKRRIIDRGDTVVVLLSPVPKPRPARPAASPGLDAVELDPQPSPWPAAALYHAHTLHGANTASGLNTYTQIRLEAGVLLTDHDRAVVASAIIRSLHKTTTLTGEREIWSTAPAQADSVASDGLLAAILYRSDANGAEVRNDVLGNTAKWSARVAASTRLADIDAQIAADDAAVAAGMLEPGEYQQDLRRARERVAREALESWTFEGQGYAGKDGRLRTPLLDGSYTLGWTAGRAEQAWKSWDTEHYRVTAHPSPAAPPVDPPRARVGPTEFTYHEIHEAPQIVQYTIRWDAIYAIGTWLFESSVAIPSTGAFTDALPLLPLAYRLAGPVLLFGNAAAVSAYVKDAREYHRLVEADHDYEVFSPFFYIILVRRVGGETLLTTRDLPASRLCAIVDEYSQGSTSARRVYIWGVTLVERVNDLFDRLPLSTDDVIGNDLLFVEH